MRTRETVLFRYRGPSGRIKKVRLGGARGNLLSLLTILTRPPRVAVDFHWRTEVHDGVSLLFHITSPPRNSRIKL